MHEWVGKLKKKRAVIPAVLGNLDFHMFEVALEWREHFFPKCCCFSGHSSRSAQLGAVPVSLVQLWGEGSGDLGSVQDKTWGSALERNGKGEVWGGR